MLSCQQAQKKIGVVAASAGNHALALAYHGHELNIPVTVVMPIVAPIMKVNLCRQAGANIIVQGADINVVSPSGTSSIISIAQIYTN